MHLEQFIRDIPDFPKPGILFKDITPLLQNPAAFSNCIEQMAKPFLNQKIDVIAAAESRGFIFAAPLALKFKCPMVLLRKPGKLPYKSIKETYDLEYGSAELQMHVDSIKPGQNVLIVDDLLATGGTMHASANLIKKAGGNVAGFAFVIELAFLNGRERLKHENVHSLITY